MPKAVSADADVFITGEVKYHDYFNYENDILVAETMLLLNAIRKY